MPPGVGDCLEGNFSEVVPAGPLDESARWMIPGYLVRHA